MKYQFQVFWCPVCRAFSPWPKEFSDRTTYGRNTAAFSIFEIIELCVSQRSVTQTLNTLFGFQMNENVVGRFKERGAEYYRETRKNVLAKMVKGNLIHADETRIRPHAKTAYVWVFATFREVVYFYSETREGKQHHPALIFQQTKCGNTRKSQHGRSPTRVPAEPEAHKNTPKPPRSILIWIARV